jgi:hypothetical protein
MVEMTEEVKKTSYKPLWWLIALCAFPYIGGTIYYQYHGMWSEGETTNYGTLVEPAREVAGVTLAFADGSEAPIEDLRKKWLMLYLLDAPCGEACKKNIYFMRQVRKAMAQDRFRISRLMIVESLDLLDDELKTFLKEYPGMQVAVVKAGDKTALRAALDDGSADIYKKIMLVDPLGNYMMRYPVDLDPKPFLKDIKRLLTVSRIG